jgi:hypothetical protein
MTQRLKDQTEQLLTAWVAVTFNQQSEINIQQSAIPDT